MSDLELFGSIGISTVNFWGVLRGRSMKHEYGRVRSFIVSYLDLDFPLAKTYLLSLLSSLLLVYIDLLIILSHTWPFSPILVRLSASFPCSHCTWSTVLGNYKIAAVSHWDLTILLIRLYMEIQILLWYNLVCLQLKQQWTWGGKLLTTLVGLSRK